jgi:hypothetical protein
LGESPHHRGLEDKKPNKIDETLIGMTLAMCSVMTSFGERPF